MKVCSLLAMLILINLINAHTFNCIFDKVNRDLATKAQYNIPEVPLLPPGQYLNGRRLTSTTTSSYGSLRIQLEYSQFSSATITPGVNGASTTTSARLTFILNSLFVAQQFFEKRLAVGRLSSITIPPDCVDIDPTINSGTVVNNIDLYIFAQYLSDKNKGYGATGKSCDYVTGVNPLPDLTLQVGRPSVGRIIFNTYNLVDRETALTNRLFQSITTTTIHEITHILGFDSELYATFLDPSTGNVYTSPTIEATTLHSSRPNSTFLTTPYVKQWAQNHYGCSSLPGMLLENEDATGSGGGSHWERAAIYDQLMTATAFGATKGIFGVTYALLKDTGWYLVDEAFTQTTNYGYNKGCSFVLDACYSSTSFPEFCDSATLSNVSSCQTTFYGKSVCSSSSANMADSCGIYVPYFHCVDPASVDPGFQPHSYQAFGTNSFCVESTIGIGIIPTNLQSRCYPYICGTSSIVFTIGSYSITCLSTEAGVIKTLSALTGSLTCPIFSQFCTVSRKTCANWCSQNGYCTNGICNCISGSSNSDCSVACTASQYYSVSSSSCVSSCTSGTYLNTYSNTCQSCKSPCGQCSGTPTNCIGCTSTSALKYLYSGLCYSSCPNTTYTSGFSCIVCDLTVFCQTCQGSSTTCTSCTTGKYLSSGTCISTCPSLTDLVNNQCVTSCPDYLLLTVATSTCDYCSGSTYYQLGACVSTCTANATNTFYPDATYHACLPCNSSCLSCDGPYQQNCTSCYSSSSKPYLLLKICWSTCPKGFYANPSSGKCQVCPVQLSCQSCRYNSGTSSPQCTSCIYGTYFLSNWTCSTSCATTQYKNTWNNSCTNCDPACLTCNGPSSFSCLSCPGSDIILTNSSGGYCIASCPVGYIKVGTSCQLCDGSCLTCNGTNGYECITCQSGYYLYSGYCRYICPTGTYPDATSKQCLPCDLSCSYCFDGTPQGCTSCSGTAYLYNFTCTGTCPNGLTPNQWNVCYQLLFKFSALALGLLLASF